jgi:DNA-binding MarR family transcriptional regulator
MSTVSFCKGTFLVRKRLSWHHGGVSGTQAHTTAARRDSGSERVQWLDDTEMEAWRGFVELHLEISAALDAQLQEDHGLSGGDYGVLVSLSEAPEQRRRMCDLAMRLQLSPSGLTRRLDGLVRAGLVERVPSPADRRVILAVLTDAGAAKLEAAAPDHVANVRRQLFDHLDRAQIEALAETFSALRQARSPQCPTVD